MVGDHQGEPEFLSHLADLYEQKGELSVATVVRQTLIRNHSAPEISCGNPFSMDYNDYDAVVRSCEAAVQEKPDNFWSWHSLCQVQIRRGNFDAAIRACTVYRLDQTAFKDFKLDFAFVLFSSNAT